MKQSFKRLASTVLALALTASLGVTAVAGSAISNDGRYYSDFNSYEECLEAAATVTRDVAAEGEILLKNENDALPMLSKGRVTVFGISQVNVVGAGNGGNFSAGSGGMTIADALEAEGFSVNARITDAYKVINSTDYGNETPGLETFAGQHYYEQSYEQYNDAAFIIISRTCAEGSDKSVNTGEISAADAADFDASRSYSAGDAVRYNGIAYKFTADHSGEWTGNDVWQAYAQMKHAAPATVDGVAYKHELQLTDSEEKLIQYVEAQGFKKIILIANSSNNLELADVAADAGIDAILWMGRPGVDGLTSFAQIVDGDINPSGRTVDLVFADFTSDPTWQNFGTNEQTGSSSTYTYTAEDGTVYTENGVEYEEDIYLGYRYAETAAYEEGYDYDSAVLYPFGYGLSYSTFAFNSIELYAVENGEQVALGDVTDLETKLASSVGDIADIKQIVAKVEVENTGDKAGKQTVEVYVSAPYVDAASSTQKAYVVLAGYGKTEILQPGKKQVVEVTLNVQDFASYDAANLLGAGTGYTLEKGNYSVMALSDSHAWNADYVAAGKGFGVSAGFTLASNVFLGLDDYTDNATSNLFSAENGMYYTLRTNANASETLSGDWTVDTAAFNDNDNDPMTLMLRGQFASTYPVAPTADGLSMSKDYVDEYNYWYDYVLDGVTDTDGSVLVDPADYASAEEIGEDGLYISKLNLPWLENINKFMSSDRYQTITQSTDSSAQKYSLAQMSGIDPLSEEILTADDTDVEDFIGLSGQAAWDLFLNDKTWAQLVDVVTMQATAATTEPGGSYLDYGITGNGSMSGVDSPLNLNSTYQFCDNPTLAATFNDTLATRQGQVIGDIALSRGYNRWWGPTVNLHRSPFSGRAHEYYTSDPILCGTMASAECLGAESRGLACCPKHAVLNEQETNRSDLLSFASEQAIRELYAKPLQMLLQEGEGLGVMGAMNRIGTVHNYGNYNFITGLLHNEWDMRGSYTTDMGGSHGTMNPELMIRAGLNDVNNGKSYFSTGVWDATLRNGLGDVKVAVGTDSERESFAQYYSVRTAATMVLYMHANSGMNQNGYDFTKWAGGELAVAGQGVAYSASCAIPEELGVAAAVYSASELPDGLSLDASSAELSGIPTTAGDYTFTVSATVDAWLSAFTTYTLHVDSAFYLDAMVADEVAEPDENGTLHAAAGDEIIIDVLSDYIAPTEITVNEMYLRMVGMEICTGSELTYSIDGELPEGLELDEDGEIMGTIETPGTYSFNFIATFTQYDQCLRTDGVYAAVSIGPVNGVMTVTPFSVPVTIAVE